LRRSAFATAIEEAMLSATPATGSERFKPTRWVAATVGLLAGCAAAFAASFAARLVFGALLGECTFPVQSAVVLWSLLALLNGALARAATGHSRWDALPYGICGAIAALKGALQPSAVDGCVACTVLALCLFLWLTGRDRRRGAERLPATRTVLGYLQAALIILANVYFIDAADRLLVEESHLAAARTPLYWLTLGQLEALFRSGLWPWFWLR
jgi:hypothetical protein